MLAISEIIIASAIFLGIATSAVTGFVNLLSVLLKLANKIRINKEVAKGIKGIRVVEFMKFPTEKKVSNLKFYIISPRYFIK